MMMSLRGRKPEAIPCLAGCALFRQNASHGKAGIASSQRTLLAMTWAMKALDDGSAAILEKIQGMV